MLGGGYDQRKSTIKKQSSFLIENKKKATNKSFLDLSADELCDNKSDVSGRGGDDTSQRLVRLKH